MRLPTLLLSVLALTTEARLLGQQTLGNFKEPNDQTISTKVPTAREAAVMARRILALTPIGTFATNFPNDAPKSPWDHRPENANGVPIGLTDSIADCEGEGNPTILAIDVATQFRNAAAGSNVSLTVQWYPPYPPKKRMGGKGSKHSLPFAAANQPRFALMGRFESMTQEEVREHKIVECFTKMNPETRYWLPGGGVHEAHWARLVVEAVYFVGGFGDRAYIGWIDVEDWRNVTRKEWQGVRLDGERKGWREEL